MLKLYIKKDIFIKVRPLQEIVIRGDSSLSYASYYVNQHRVKNTLVIPISISFSEEINSYSGNDILDISNEENQRKEYKWTLQSQTKTETKEL